ncbi:MAG: hypothetical protein P4L38_02465, partial [Syntrophaceae bacterium]|nr:hypothetical protein [Syntrophaceae bacterium]
MLRSVEPRACSQIEKFGVLEVFKKIITIVVLSFLLVTAADTLSNAKTAYYDQNPLQSCTQGLAASS